MFSVVVSIQFDEHRLYTGRDLASGGGADGVVLRCQDAGLKSLFAVVTAGRRDVTRRRRVVEVDYGVVVVVVVVDVRLTAERVEQLLEGGRRRQNRVEVGVEPVSYTHLTLPTILRV